MSFKTRQLGRSPALRDGSPLPSHAATMGLDVQLLTPQKLTLKLDGESLPVLEANDYGSLELLTWQDRNIHILGMEVDLTLVKGGLTNGLITTVDLDVGMGSAAASAATLATTMIDYLEKQDLDTDALSLTLQAHVLGQATATFPKQLADAAANKVYLNVGLPVGITADDAITVTGSIDFYIIDLGNRTS